MQLTADEIDDVLYLTRVNEKEELLTFLNELASRNSSTPRAVLETSIDPENGNTAIHFCAANGLNALLQSLLETLKADQPSELINKRNESSNTPLHWAALNGHLEVCKLLVNAGADMWIRNSAGNLAIFEAERAGKDDVVAWLLEIGGTEKEKEGVQQEASAGADEEHIEIKMSAGETDSVDEAQDKLNQTSLNG